MEHFSVSFSGASSDLADWVKAVTGQRPVELPAGQADQKKGIAIAPVTMTRAERRADPVDPCLSATGWFALSIGRDAPDRGCTWYDALYFAAFASPLVELGQDPLPAGYWTTPAGLTLMLGRRIEQRTEIPKPGIVQHPLVFSMRAHGRGRGGEDLVANPPDDEIAEPSGERS